MSDGTKASNGDSKKLEVVEVEDEKLDIDIEVGATMFDVDDVKQKLNNTKKESRVLDGESVLESLADNSQIIHVKTGKTVDNKTKSTKKSGKTKKEEATSEKRISRKNTDSKEDR